MRIFHGYQTYFSAFCGKAQADAWLSRPDEIARRPRGDPRATGARPQAAGHLRREAHAASGFPRAVRLRAPRDFDACRSPHYRAFSRWIALAARLRADGEDVGAAVRIGLIVSKRMAPDSVQRNRVKRILRESARAALPQLTVATAATAARGVDLTLRLKEAYPRATPIRLSQPAFKRVLRADADTVFKRLRVWLDADARALAGDPAAGATPAERCAR